MVFGQWYKFVVKQMKNAAGQYVYTVDIDGTRVHEVINTDPRKGFIINIYIYDFSVLLFL